MFHFPAFPHHLVTRSGDGSPAQPRLEFPPFGHPRIITLARQPRGIAGRNVLHQLCAKESTRCPIKLNKTQKTIQNKYARNHYTNHKQPTTHNPHQQQQSLAGWWSATTTSGGRSHGVEREPDSVLARLTFCASPNAHPTTTRQ